jgi:hypothetical protein
VCRSLVGEWHTLPDLLQVRAAVVVPVARQVASARVERLSQLPRRARSDSLTSGRRHVSRTQLLLLVLQQMFAVQTAVDLMLE